MSGTWVFRRTRIPAAAVFENLDDGVAIDKLTRMYDGLTREQIEAALAFREECRRQSLAIANDPHEKDILDWIEKAAEGNGREF
jgi:uncharacterized protein (DUF433 family)